jgi:hypothetical protein
MEMIKIGNKEITETALDNLVRLANSLEDVKTRENGDLYIKFKNDVIIENGGNFATISNGFNVQVADQIHFNPEFERTAFKEMLMESFEETKYRIVQRAAQLLDRELTHEEVEAVVHGRPLHEFGEFDEKKVKKIKLPKDSCEHDHKNH